MYNIFRNIYNVAKQNNEIKDIINKQNDEINNALNQDYPICSFEDLLGKSKLN